LEVIKLELKKKLNKEEEEAIPNLGLLMVQWALVLAQWAVKKLRHKEQKDN